MITAAVIVIGSGAFVSHASGATDGSYQDVYHVYSCAAGNTINAAPVFSKPSTLIGLSEGQNCSTLGGLYINNDNSGATNGEGGQWQAATPSPDLRIIGVISSGMADCNLHADGWNAEYYWGDSGKKYGAPQITIDCNGATGTFNGNASFLSAKLQPSQYFGFEASCVFAHGCHNAGAGGLVVSARGIDLEVQDTTGPMLDAVGPDNLYHQTGWVRGSWSTSLSGSDPSGVCALQTAVNGKVIATYKDTTPDTSNWSQCPGTTLTSSVDTSQYPDASKAISLSDTGSNAAGASTAQTQQLNVDNAPVSLALSGPSDAPATGGTQHVTATATAGPSGISAIYCSVDGGPSQAYQGATASVQVSGLGSHKVSCYAHNNAHNSSGALATSPTETFGLSIRQPTASAITFAHNADALRCTKTGVKVKVPGKLKTVKRHGKKVRVHGRPHTKIVRVRKCHVRTKVRTVLVPKTVIRHGKRVQIRVKAKRRVPVLPHAVNKPTLRIGHGRKTTVSGFLGLTGGTVLAGQTVEVLSAPANGDHHFREMATATTNASGDWTATVPAGPSRLIEASYAGNGTDEPALSSTVRLTVPASVRVNVTPRNSHWGGRIEITGRLLGGYIPAAGELVVLRIGFHGGSAEIGHLYTRKDGRFSSPYTFSQGSGSATYRIWATTARESDYPYARARSPSVTVRIR